MEKRSSKLRVGTFALTRSMRVRIESVVPLPLNYHRQVSCRRFRFRARPCAIQESRVCAKMNYEYYSFECRTKEKKKGRCRGALAFFLRPMYSRCQHPRCACIGLRRRQPVKVALKSLLPLPNTEYSIPVPGARKICTSWGRRATKEKVNTI